MAANDSLPPDWASLLEEILDQNSPCLGWELPEGWFHAELFGKLKGLTETSGWDILPSEIPYVTFSPVIKPRDNRPVKWVDLCLHSESGHAWCWFELKVRRRIPGKDNASRQSRDAFRKDAAALVGFDCQSTAKLWAEEGSSSNFFSRHVDSEKASTLSQSRHYFAAAFVQIDGLLVPEASWEAELLRQEIHTTVDSRARELGRHANILDLQIEFRNKICGRAKGHSFILAEWRREPR